MGEYFLFNYIISDRMVIKTTKCIFSGKEIYPGHGKLQVRKDGRQLQFIDQRSQSLFNQGKKTAKITWTRNWRVLNKKVKIVRETKKVKKKTKKNTACDCRFKSR